MTEINETLKDRGEIYGTYKTNAQITQDLKNVMEKTQNWSLLSDDKKESLHMIAHKIGRILNGDPEYADSWHDIAGYAMLTEKLCTN